MKSTALKDKFSNKAIALAAMLTVMPAAANAADNDASYSTSNGSYTQSTEQGVVQLKGASEYGDYRSKIGVMLYYFSDNKGTPEQYGKLICDIIEKEAKKQGFDYDAEYFITIMDKSDKKGIALELYMGSEELPLSNYMDIYNNPKIVVDARTRENDRMDRLKQHLTAANYSPNNN